MSSLADVGVVLAEISGLEIVVADSGSDVADIVRRLRRSGAEIAVLLIDSAIPALDRAMLHAAIGPLAIERAPHTRIGAVEIGGGAAQADVVAAARYLASARSTTGQILTVTAET
jgi:hypothetical protein